MKTSIIAILFTLTFAITIAQIPVGLENQNIKFSKKIARKELIKSLLQENIMSKFKIYTQIMTLKPMPVMSYEISARASDYDSTKRIVDYLTLDDIFQFNFVIFLKGKKLHATLDCHNNVYYLDCKPCSYTDSMKMKDHYNNYKIKKIYDAIVVDRKSTLLFTVKYLREAVWFVEKNEVKIYCIQDKLIYNPDDFIKKRCSVEAIKSLAREKLN